MTGTRAAFLFAKESVPRRTLSSFRTLGGAALVALRLFSSDETEATQFHVTTQGSSTGRGTRTSPWNLDHAFSHPPAVKPGDTILVHGGVYFGQFLSLLSGTEADPIIVRGAPGRRVTLSAPPGAPGLALIVRGDHTWYWGLEFTDLNEEVGSQNAGAVFVGALPPDMATGNRFINCVMHDATGNGISDQVDAEGTEIYGCVIYYNGRLSGDRKYAYGIYGQNRGRRKTYSDNVIFGNYGEYAIHLYSRSGTIDSISVTNNVLFSAPGGSSALLVSSPTPAQGLTVTGNVLYASGEGSVLFEEHSAVSEPLISGNIFWRGRIILHGSTTGRVFALNTVRGRPPEQRSMVILSATIDPAEMPENTWITSPRESREPAAILRRNRYEPNRVLLVVQNPPDLPAITIDPGPTLVPGQSYAVIDVQDLYGPPVAKGTFSGTTIKVPLDFGRVSEPVTVPSGKKTPVHTRREFGVYFLTSRVPE